MFLAKRPALLDTLTNNERFWTNKAIQDPCCRAWLDVIPVTPMLTFSNAQFRCAMCYRFLIVNRNFIEGMKCYCSLKTPIDGYGHHFVAGCAEDGARVDRHCDMVNTLKYEVNYCQMIARLEEKNTLSTNDIPGNRQRPDLSVLESVTDSRFNKELIDVSVISAISGTMYGNIQQVSRHHADTKVLQACQRRAADKITKYRQKAEENHCAFVPFALDVNGCLNKEGKKFILKLAERASMQKGLPVATLKNWFLKNISATLQKSNGDMIHRKTLRCRNIIPDDIQQTRFGDDSLIRSHNQTN